LRERFATAKEVRPPRVNRAILTIREKAVKEIRITVRELKELSPSFRSFGFKLTRARGWHEENMGNHNLA